MRLHGKNTMLIRGKPLIAYTIQAAKRAHLLGRVIVSTDDDEISRVAVRFGAEVVTRPHDLARDDSPIDETYRHVLTYIAETDGFAPEIVVCMQANIPIRREGEIDAVIQRLMDTPWATAVATAKRITERPEWMKRLKDGMTGEIAPFVDAGVNYREQDLPDLYLLDGATIAVRSKVLKGTAGDRRVHAYLGDPVVIHIHELCYSIEIDDWEDFKLVEYLLSRAES